MPGVVKNPFAYMERAAVFALSSDYEGFGNVLVEAMACGTPVVSTDCLSGPREILEDGRFGSLVPVGNATTMAEAILNLLERPTPAEMLRERASQFSVEGATERYLQALGMGPWT